jgi:hypothetical protein
MDAVTGISAGTSYLMGSCGAVPIMGGSGVNAPQQMSVLSASGGSAGPQAESFFAALSASASNKDLLGALLLMLTLEYMRGDDSEGNKKDLLGLMALMLQQSQQNGSSLLIYSASDMSSQAGQLQTVSSSIAAGAYAGAAAGGASSGGVNLVA